MKRFRARPVCLLFLALALVSGPLLAQQLGEKVPNWAVPSAAHGSKGGMTIQADIGLGGTAFVPVDPCRIVNTRNAGFPPGFGPPSLTPGVPTDFALLSGPCTGFPPAVLAYSLNFTVTNTQGPGFIKVYPQGGAVPPVSTLNYNGVLPPGLAIANAAIVPAGVGSGITVLAGVSGTDLLIDINGYFVGNGNAAPLNPNEFVGWQGDVSSQGVVYGKNTNFNGFGVLGVSDSDSGVGVRGQNNVGPNGFGVQGFSTNIGVYGDSTNNTGVEGDSHGTGLAGVLGFADSNAVPGVLGENSAGGFAMFSLGDFGASGTKSFVEPHPEDATKVIRYVCLEGPEAGTYFRGRGRFVNGAARIDVPESFRMVSDEEGLTVQITPIGHPAAVAVTRMSLDGIEAEATRDVEFSFIVHGVRKAFKDFQPIAEGWEFRPRSADQRIPAYLTGEARRRLIANGTYNADGTVNMATAERAGWTKIWADQEAAARQAAAKAAEERSRQHPVPAPAPPIDRP